MDYKSILKVLDIKIKKSESSEYSSEDLDFFKSIKRTLSNKSYTSLVKTKHNLEIESFKKLINNNLDKLKL